MNPLTQSKNTTILLVVVALVLACFALAPATDAQCPQICDSNDNTAVGDSALISNTTGIHNTAVGFDALYSNTTGFGNTATGFMALTSNTTGAFNTAYGLSALNSNGGNNNTAVGASTLEANTGSDNTAIGYATLINNEGSNNTATGDAALSFNDTGHDNTANGAGALISNVAGVDNTAVGSNALASTVYAFDNTAIGYYALYGVPNSSTGVYNTATGSLALMNYTTGGANTANGYQALFSNTTGKNNTADGYSALFGNTTGSFNIALGNNAGFNLTTGINNIDIGNPGVAGETKTIRIGKQGTQTATYIAAINGATVPTGVAVIVDSSGHLGTTTSSARFKDEIKPMDNASEAILALKPVTFRYKHELDPERIPQFGLVAEDVEKVNPDLVARDAEGKPYTVRYEAVNAMLLNEFLKEHHEVQELKKQVAALTAGLEKMSAQLELNKPTSQTIANNH